mgnify:CR=1 FL=1
MRYRMRVVSRRGEMEIEAIAASTGLLTGCRHGNVHVSGLIQTQHDAIQSLY